MPIYLHNPRVNVISRGTPEGIVLRYNSVKKAKGSRKRPASRKKHRTTTGRAPTAAQIALLKSGRRDAVGKKKPKASSSPRPKSKAPSGGHSTVAKKTKKKAKKSAAKNYGKARKIGGIKFDPARQRKKGRSPAQIAATKRMLEARAKKGYTKPGQTAKRGKAKGSRPKTSRPKSSASRGRRPKGVTSRGKGSYKAHRVRAHEYVEPGRRPAKGKARGRKTLYRSVKSPWGSVNPDLPILSVVSEALGTGAGALLATVLTRFIVKDFVQVTRADGKSTIARNGWSVLWNAVLGIGGGLALAKWGAKGSQGSLRLKTGNFGRMMANGTAVYLIARTGGDLTARVGFLNPEKTLSDFVPKALKPFSKPERPAVTTRTAGILLGGVVSRSQAEALLGRPAGSVTTTTEKERLLGRLVPNTEKETLLGGKGGGGVGDRGLARMRPRWES